jgi:hypothetical protein
MRRFLLQHAWHTDTPPKDGWYLTTVNYEPKKYLEVSQFILGKWRNDYVGMIPHPVLAWMPLPEPYAGEEASHEMR